jgi:ketosteroid isomerase-like protein
MGGGTEGDYTSVCGNCRDVLWDNVGPDYAFQHTEDGEQNFIPVLRVRDVVSSAKDAARTTRFLRAHGTARQSQGHCAAVRHLQDTSRTMSEKSTTPNVIVRTRQVFEAGNRSELDLVVSFYDLDATFDLSPMGLGIFEGRAAIRAFLGDWFSAYEHYQVEAEEIVELANGVTLSIVTQKGRLAGSDGVVDVRYAAVAVWRAGQVVLTANYADIDEARAAAERLSQEQG